MTESLRLLRVSRAPAGDLVCSNKKTLHQVSENRTHTFVQIQSSSIYWPILIHRTRKRNFRFRIYFQIKVP